MKNIFKNKDFVAGFLASFLGFLLVALLGLFFIYHFRIDPVSSNKILEKQTIFSQENSVVDTVKKTSPAVDVFGSQG